MASYDNINIFRPLQPFAADELERYQGQVGLSESQPLLSPAQREWLGMQMQLGAGTREAGGDMPEWPAKGMTREEMYAGPYIPSMEEHFRSGDPVAGVTQGVFAGLDALDVSPLFPVATSVALRGVRLGKAATSALAKSVRSGIGGLPKKVDPLPIRKSRAAEQGYDLDDVWYHGSTWDFDEFSRDTGEISDYFGGRGTYLTNNPRDAGANYAGEGPDLTNRIRNEADRLMTLLDGLNDTERLEFMDVERLHNIMGKSEEKTLEILDDAWDSSAPYNDELLEALTIVARRRLKGPTEGSVYPLVHRANKPFDVSKDGDTFLRYEQKWIQRIIWMKQKGIWNWLKNWLSRILIILNQKGNW